MWKKIIPAGTWKPSAQDSSCIHPTDVNSEKWVLRWHGKSGKPWSCWHQKKQHIQLAGELVLLGASQDFISWKVPVMSAGCKGQRKKKQQGKIRQDKPEHVQFVLPTLQLYPHSSEQKAVQRHNKSLSSLTLLRNVMETELKWFPEIRWQSKIKPFPTATLW